MVRLAIVLIAASLPLTAAAGELEIRLGNLPGASTADVVVWAMPVGREVPGVKATAVMDQKNRMFIPHVLPVQKGTSVSFPNSDNIQHQVYSFSAPKIFQLPLYRGTSQSPIVFDEPGLVSLGCNIHDQMSAWIVVVDTPYFARTTWKEKATLTNLDPGPYDVMLWYPGMKSQWVPRRVNVGEGRTVFDINPGSN